MRGSTEKGEMELSAGFLKAHHTQHCPDKDTEHGGRGGEHPEEDIPGNGTNFEGHIGPVKIEPANGAEGLCLS